MGHAMTAIAQGGGIVDLLVPLALIFVVFYFFVLRPQSKQRKAREEMLGALKKGDKVVTNGGLFGTVSAIQDGVVTLLISDKVRVRVLLNQIAGYEQNFLKKVSD